LTGIPRSSVGYYIRKFNKKYGEGGRLRKRLSPILMSADESLKMNENKLVESPVFEMISLKSFFDIIAPWLGREDIGICIIC